MNKQKKKKIRQEGPHQICRDNATTTDGRTAGPPGPKEVEELRFWEEEYLGGLSFFTFFSEPSLTYRGGMADRK